MGPLIPAVGSVKLGGVVSLCADTVPAISDRATARRVRLFFVDAEQVPLGLWEASGGGFWGAALGRGI